MIVLLYFPKLTFSETLLRIYGNSLLFLGLKEELKILQEYVPLEFYIQDTRETSHGVVQDDMGSHIYLVCNYVISLDGPSQKFYLWSSAHNSGSP